MRHRAGLILLAVAIAACSYGTRIGDFRPAHSPNGVNVRVTTTRGALNGELIELRDTGLVVLTAGPDQLCLIPYAQVRSTRFEQVGSSIGDGRAPTAQQRERLRLFSRFPQGMSPQVLETLLKAYGQTELLEIQ